MGTVSRLFTQMAAKIIAVDDTVVPAEQLQAVREMLKSRQFSLEGKDARKLLQGVKGKHLVNSITVVKANSSLVFSSEGNGIREAENAADFFQYAGNRISKTEAIAVKRSRDWVMMLSSQGKIFVVKANSSISTIEMRAIAKDIEKAMGKELGN